MPQSVRSLTDFASVTFKMCHRKEKVCPGDITQLELPVVEGSVGPGTGGLSLLGSSRLPAEPFSDDLLSGLEFQAQNLGGRASLLRNYTYDLLFIVKLPGPAYEL